MKVSEIYKQPRKIFSFEFFPPKTEDGEAKLFETVTQLKDLKPDFVSVTYGAMGTTRANTQRIVHKIKIDIGIEGAAHLTCVSHSRDEMENILDELMKNGIENIVALRGDPPKGETEFKPVKDGFHYANELVSFIRKHPRFSKAFSLAVAGYPECHIECRDKAKDLDNLKRKVDAGADIIITQLFFDNHDYFNFVERARKAGINIPIVAGIMPLTHGPQIEKFSVMCGCRIPDEMQQKIAAYGDDQQSVEAYGIEWATRQCRELIEQGAPGIHFYTLNKSKATREILTQIR